MRFARLFVLGLTFSIAPAHAHHSFAATFTENIIVVEGVVETLKFSNPHVIVYFNVTGEAGEVTAWWGEGAAATN